MPRFDIGVFSKDRQLVLVVEIVAGKDTSPGNAARFRKNLLEAGALPSTPFLLLAYKTHLYLWKRETDESLTPDFKAAIKPILHSYLGVFADNETISLRGESIGFALQAWLKDVVSGFRKDETDADRMLRDSGVTDLIRGGEMRTELA